MNSRYKKKEKKNKNHFKKKVALGVASVILAVFLSGCQGFNPGEIREVWTKWPFAEGSRDEVALDVTAYTVMPPAIAEIIHTDEEEKESAKTSGQQSDLPRESAGLDLENKETDKSGETVEKKQEIQASNIMAGDVISREAVSGKEDSFFSESDIVEGDAVFERINDKSYRENGNISLSQLSYLRVLHNDFDGNVRVGEIIVNKQISQDVLQIFRELYDNGYEIQSMRLVDEYWTGDTSSTDMASIEANNTSGFFYRTMTKSNQLSNHARGMAIDINPLINPYTWTENGRINFVPEVSGSYVDRDIDDKHMIKRGDMCYEAFIKRGFVWGGDWKSPVDYQHFEKA